MLKRIAQTRLNRLTGIWSIFALALLLRWAAFYLYYFVHKTPGGVAPSPLANEVYDLLARQLQNGEGLAPWYYAYRPPLYPMFVAVIYKLTGTQEPLAAVFAQSVVGAAMCLWTYYAARELGAEESTQRIAAFIAAIEPASIAVSLALVAETLSNFFIALSLVFLIRLLKNGLRRDAAACAGCVALSALARPNAAYFFAVVVLLIFALAPKRLLQAAVFLVVVAIGLGPWYLRNYLYYDGVITFAATSNFNLLFYKAVSVERLATGKSAEEVQAEFSYELERRLGIAQARDAYDGNAMWRYLVATEPRTDATMRDMAVEIYLAHPVEYALTMPIYLVRLMAYSEMYAGFPALHAADMALNVALYALAFVGLILFAGRRWWIHLAITAPASVYFLVVPTITGGVQDTRARTNITACLAILAAYGLAALWSKWRERK